VGFEGHHADELEVWGVCDVLDQVDHPVAWPDADAVVSEVYRKHNLDRGIVPSGGFLQGIDVSTPVDRRDESLEPLRKPDCRSNFDSQTIMYER